MRALRWAAIILALSQAGWMTFDGSRALIAGHYATPKTGAYAGQLGPWSKLVATVGIEPRSNLMKTIFVVCGVIWLTFIACYGLGFRWAWWGMLFAATGTLWYLWAGTLVSLIIIGLLLLTYRATYSAPRR
jgi:hypothetical protein